MNDLETRIRDVLTEDASRAPLVARMPDGVRPKVRRRQAAMAALATAAALAVVIGSVFALRGLEIRDRETGIDRTPRFDRPVFERTVTVGGVKLTSPSDWYLVDHWAEWGSGDTTSLAIGVPLVEVTNFDTGLLAPVCGPRPTRAHLPADGIAIFVTSGRGSGKPCGANAETSVRTVEGVGTVDVVMAVGPEASEEDRAEAGDIARSIEATDLVYNGRPGPPWYVLDGGQHGSTDWLLEARRSDQGVDLMLIEFESDGVARNVVQSPRVPHPNAIEGETFGAVTEEAVRVEYHRAGLTVPLVARLVDLPASLLAPFDAYVFGTQPAGSPFEVVAIGEDGSVLGSNVPALVDSERVGRVHAFGAVWIVKVSSSADGSWQASCVEPAAERSPTPCERAVEGGVSVQAFRDPNPAVFVTQPVGDTVEAIDVVSDDGRVFHAVMLRDRGGWVAVVALEGSGRGRFVYHLTDGRVDEGRRPEARAEWRDLGQQIGEGSFSPPDGASS